MNIDLPQVPTSVHASTLTGEHLKELHEYEIAKPKQEAYALNSGKMRIDGDHHQHLLSQVPV